MQCRDLSTSRPSIPFEEILSTRFAQGDSRGRHWNAILNRSAGCIKSRANFYTAGCCSALLRAKSARNRSPRLCPHEFGSGKSDKKCRLICITFSCYHAWACLKMRCGARSLKIENWLLAVRYWLLVPGEAAWHWVWLGGHWVE